MKIKPTPSAPEATEPEAEPSTRAATGAVSGTDQVTSAAATGAIPKVRTSVQQSPQGSIQGESEVARIETEVKSLLLHDSDPMDADIVTLPCSICQEEVICTVKDIRAMTIHLEQVHRQRVCPVCSQLFDESMEGINEYFHLHVENHFDVPHIYPTLGSGFEAIGGAN